MQSQSKARLWKMGGASLAYLPMLVLLFTGALGIPLNHAIAGGCAIFNFPALSLAMLIQTYHVNYLIQEWSPIVLMFLWSSFMAWFFWRAVGTFQGDDESEDRKGQYDWKAFRIRFVIGFVIGFLWGWHLESYSNSMITVLIASIVAGLAAGFIFGIARPPNFWSRP